MTNLRSYHALVRPLLSAFFFFNDTATTEIYTLSLHDALPILPRAAHEKGALPIPHGDRPLPDILEDLERQDRKSTRLNSSHTVISYAVFCLKKKKKITTRAAKDTSQPPLSPTQTTTDTDHYAH